jgi:hypothetical protein
MNIEELITGFTSELDAVTNKDQAKAVAVKIIGALRDLNALDANKALQGLNDHILKMEDLISGHTGELLAKDAIIVDLQNELNDAHEVAADALAKYNESASSPTKVLSLKVGDKKVQVNHGITLDGTDYTAHDLVRNPTIVKQLLEMGSGAVNLMEGK